MFYILSHPDGSFELQNCDQLAQKPDGSFAALAYGGAGNWGEEKIWPAGAVSNVVEFTSPVEAERELINRGGVWSGDPQGPF